MMLSEIQETLLSILIKNEDNPLTIRNIRDELDLSTPSLVHYHIVQLEKKGYLKRKPSNPKDYKILNEPEKEVSYLNLYGMAKCGPGGNILSGDPEERIPLASRLIPCPVNEAFLVKAYGDSMEPKIYEGDLIICKEQNYAEHKDVVVCTRDEKEVLIKRLFIDNKHYILESFNRNAPPIVCHKEDLKVEGIVVGLISSKSLSI